MYGWYVLATLAVILIAEVLGVLLVRRRAEGVPLGAASSGGGPVSTAPEPLASGSPHAEDPF